MPGVGEQCAAGVRAAPIASEYSTTEPPSKADIEFARFEKIAQPMPGSGWFDPINGSAEMPSGFIVPHPSEWPAGVLRGWTARSWIRHLKYMANACAALNPEKSSDYLSRAEQLADHCNV